QCHRRALAISETNPGAEQWIGPELERLAYVLYLRGSYEEAERLAQRAVAKFEKNPRSGDADLALSLGTLGEIYNKQGLTAKSGSLLERAAEILELRMRSADNLEELFRLGYWYTAQGRWPDAGRIAEKAVALCQGAKRLDQTDL